MAIWDAFKNNQTMKFGADFGMAEIRDAITGEDADFRSSRLLLQESPSPFSILKTVYASYI